MDAPDIDSVEHANRALADRLVEAADLCCFVTTATRYADQVPWTVLQRVQDRGLPLVVIVNRMPPDPSDRTEVLADVRRLFNEAGFQHILAAGPDAEPRDLVAVQEGALDPEGDRLVEGSIAPVMAEVARLRADREARLELAARALTGSLAGLGETIDRIADDVDHEAIDVEAVRRIAERSYEAGLAALRQELSQGTFLREEALRRWQTFVGADQMTRFFSEGIGRIRGALAAVFRPATAPVAEIWAATTDDLVAIARLEAGEAARRTATAWSEDSSMRLAVAEDAELWLPSADFESRLQERIEGWMESIVEDIQTRRPLETDPGPRRVGGRQCARYQRHARHLPAHGRADRRRGRRRGRDSVPEPEAPIGVVWRGGDGGAHRGRQATARGRLGNDVRGGAIRRNSTGCCRRPRSFRSWRGSSGWPQLTWRALPTTGS